MDRPAISDLKEIMRIWRWPSFSPSEFMCHGSQTYKIVPYSMDCLQSLRLECDFPFAINSGYRSPEHNAEVSDTGTTGPHTTGQAFDIKALGPHAFRMISLAAKHGFTGIGIAQKGAPESRYVHLDTIVSGQRPWVWSY